MYLSLLVIDTKYLIGFKLKEFMLCPVIGVRSLIHGFGPNYLRC